MPRHTAKRVTLCTQVLSAINKGMFGEPKQFADLTAPLANGNDYYLLAYDFPDYLRALDDVDRTWRDPAKWCVGVQGE